MLKDDYTKYSKKKAVEEPEKIQNEVPEVSDEVKEVVAPVEEAAIEPEVVAEPKKKKAEKEEKPIKVLITIEDLNIRKGPGKNNAVTGLFTGKGEFEITKVQKGDGASAGWGKLADGRGWISMDFAKII